jgi:hypothetical protein
MKPDEVQQEIKALLHKHIEVQEQLIKAQQEIIHLKNSIENQRPSAPGDDGLWHKVSGGITTDTVFLSNDAALLRKFNEWIFTFGEKYIRPYVHHQVYAELIAHMTRGLAQRRAELEVLEDLGLVAQISELEETEETPPPSEMTITKSSPQKRPPRKKKSLSSTK